MPEGPAAGPFHTGRPAVERGSPDAPVVVVAVHGRDQDPAFLRALADRLGPLPARFVAPVAAAAGAEVDLRIDPGDEHVVTDEACVAAAALVTRLAATTGYPTRS